MWKHISYLLFLFLIIGSLPPAQLEYIAEVREIEQVIQPTARPKIVPKEAIPAPEILSLIYEKAALYGASSTVMYEVVKGESGFQTCIPGDNHQSWGLVQIHLPSHPEITKEMACDPDFALDFLAKQLAQGNGRLWTVWRGLYL